MEKGRMEATLNNSSAEKALMSMRTRRPSCCMTEGMAPIPKSCILQFECWHCAFRQWLEAIEESHGRKGLPTTREEGRLAAFAA